VDVHLNVTDYYARIRQKAKQYPKHVSVFRGASPYARIAEPKALHDLVISSSAPIYHLDTSTDAFNVTSRGGIIYLSNITALQEMPDTLK
jgi:DNA-directed RNA polymerase alpha subunit